ncbi:hypothetical protein X759_29035 [Mesorhizobium sp. LSHC420B00]|nr:hypothetical protein X759_29035 [Mesorhizobium sp. LSHC420B00]
MLKPLLDTDVADEAPGYDEEHLLTFIRLLDASDEGADWREVSRIVLHVDSDKEPERAFTAWQTHLARAHWMTINGYRYLLSGGALRSQDLVKVTAMKIGMVWTARLNGILKSQISVAKQRRGYDLSQTRAPGTAQPNSTPLAWCNA